MHANDRRGQGFAVAELDESARSSGTRALVARFAGLSGDGQFLVVVHTESESRLARSTVPLTGADTGAQVIVIHEDGDASRPIIIGRVQEAAAAPTATITLDGERLVMRAEREIELRCGDASIVLTKAGKVLIRGSYVLSRSRGANKIKGAVVDIN